MTFRAFRFWFIAAITLTVVMSLNIWFWLWMSGVSFCDAGILTMPCLMAFTTASACWIGSLARRTN